MTVVVCVDDRLGMMFNNRRQSRDIVVVEKIKSMAGNNRLLMNEYSSNLFECENVVVDNDFLKNALFSDYCFVENESIADYTQDIERVVLFKWNKVYPSDFKLDFDFSVFLLKESFDFEGNSHERITCEVWER